MLQSHTRNFCFSLCNIWVCVYIHTYSNKFILLSTLLWGIDIALKNYAKLPFWPNRGWWLLRYNPKIEATEEIHVFLVKAIWMGCACLLSLSNLDSLPICFSMKLELKTWSRVTRKQLFFIFCFFSISFVVWWKSQRS